MNILVSNDDGVYAPGIKALAQALSEIGNVIVAAPDRDRSGASNSLTLDRPLRIKELDNGFLSVEGTPTDSVLLALRYFLKEKIDMVVSGINAGANLGDDVFYSGTIAAAMEGRFLGYPAIAFSLGGTQKYYSTAAEVAKRLVAQVQKERLPPNTILSVNIPDIPFNELKGYAVTRLGTRHMSEKVISMQDPRGRTVYWIGPEGSEADAGEGTDFYAVRQKQVSITPLSIDLTRYDALPDISHWLRPLTTDLD